VCIAFRESRVLGWIKASVHAGKDCKSTGWWKGERAFASKILYVFGIGGKDFRKY